MCDDLQIARNGGTLKVRNTNCEKAVAGFERTLAASSPQIDGKTASLEAAVRTAAELVRKARLPMFGGLATDVEGMRAVMALADRSGGVVDHALSDAQFRNFKVLQSSGWITTTLTETRNRADLIVIVGTDAQKLHPRFFERIVCASESMFAEPAPKRDIVFIGKGLDKSGVEGPRIGEVVEVPCALQDAGEVMGALRAMMRGAPLAASEIAGVARADIESLAERFRKANYAVVVWAPPSLDFPNADLVVQLVSEFIKDLNQTGRAAGLALGGNEGAVTAGAVCGWQSGYPLRVSFESGKPEHDAFRFSIPRMIASNEGDLLIWVSSFTPELTPPATTIPTIVLGTPGLALTSPPAVFIPVGTPGVDHAGRLIRCDNVVSLPLRDLQRSQLPRAADVLAAIESAL
jgi:formylmethanofuran dehydrogenase subunit B